MEEEEKVYFHTPLLDDNVGKAKLPSKHDPFFQKCY